MSQGNPQESLFGKMLSYKSNLNPDSCDLYLSCRRVLLVPRIEWP